MEAQLNMLKKETEDYTCRYAAEAKKMLEDVQQESYNLGIVEKEAAEVLKVMLCLFVAYIFKTNSKAKNSYVAGPVCQSLLSFMLCFSCSINLNRQAKLTLNSTMFSGLYFL